MMPMPHIWFAEKRSPGAITRDAATAPTTTIPVKTSEPPQVGVGLISRVRGLELPLSLVCGKTSTAINKMATGVTSRMPLTYWAPVLMSGR